MLEGHYGPGFVESFDEGVAYARIVADRLLVFHLDRPSGAPEA